MTTPPKVVQLSATDPRIPAKCHEFFPASPAFAEWLADRTASLSASVEFARILCFSLRETFPKSVVSAEAVHRLAVDDDQDAIARINRTYGTPFELVFASMVFLTRISGTITAPDGAKSIDDLVVIRRQSVDAHKDKKLAYMRIWHCAYGMLAGVAIDPRVDTGDRAATVKADPERNPVQPNLKT